MKLICRCFEYFGELLSQTIVFYLGCASYSSPALKLTTISQIIFCTDEAMHYQTYYISSNGTDSVTCGATSDVACKTLVQVLSLHYRGRPNHPKGLEIFTAKTLIINQHLTVSFTLLFIMVYVNHTFICLQRHKVNYQCKLFQNMIPMFAKCNIKFSSHEDSSIAHTVFIDGLSFLHSCWQFSRINLSMKNCHAGLLTLGLKHMQSASVENCVVGNWKFRHVQNVTIKNCRNVIGKGIKSLLNFDNSSALVENITIEDTKWFDGIVVQNFSFIHIKKSKFMKNRVKNGVIKLLNSSTLILSDCVLSRNQAQESAGALFVSKSFVHIRNVKFTDNKAYGSGGAIFAENIPFMQIIGCIFTNNHAEFGGALLAKVQRDFNDISNGNRSTLIRCENSSFFNNHAMISGDALNVKNEMQVFLVASNFNNNSAVLNGGAISVTDNSNLDITSSQFYYNQARTGGAIDCQTHSTANLNNSTLIHNSKSALVAFNHTNVTITNCKFQNNSTPFNGGAIHLLHFSVSNISHTTFVQNSASQGGAVSGEDYSFLLISNCSFSGNTAVSTNYGLNGTWETFIEISAHSSIGGGGGISIFNFSKGEILQSHFLNNYACYTGGALLATSNSSISVSFTAFDNNTAGILGGAIHGTENCLVTLKDSSLNGNSLSTKTNGAGGGILGSRNCTIKIFKVHFLENKAQYAGAIGGYYTSNIMILNSSFVANTGSAIGLALKGTLNIDNSCFINNLTPLKGGAIFVFRHGSIEIKNTNFTKNKGMASGGAIHIQINSHASFHNCLFSDNFSLKGGAVTSVNSDFIHISHSNFTKNSATNGGILASSGTILMFNCVVNNNTVSGDGGSLYLEEGSKINITKSEFTENSAFGAGGVMYITTGTVTITKSSLKKNTAGTDGGVISAKHMCVITIIQTLFSENKAKGGDGSVLIGKDATRVFVSDTQIQKNSAYSSGVMNIDGNSVLEFYQTQVKNNNGKLNSGAFFISNNSLFIAMNSSFKRSAGFGPGGIYLVNSTGYLESCNLTENHGQTTGGAIAISYVDLKISNTVFLNNVAPKGKDLYYESNQNTTVDMYNCTLQHGNITLASNENNLTQFATDRNLMSCFLCLNQRSLHATVKETQYASS